MDLLELLVNLVLSKLLSSARRHDWAERVK